MDPNACLLHLRVVARRLLDAPGVAEDDEVRELAELALALDGWLTAGGFAPRDWEPLVRVAPELREALDRLGREDAARREERSLEAQRSALGELAHRVALHSRHDGTRWLLQPRCLCGWSGDEWAERPNALREALAHEREPDRPMPPRTLTRPQTFSEMRAEDDANEALRAWETRPIPRQEG
jgi:hypothetical protein